MCVDDDYTMAAEAAAEVAVVPSSQLAAEPKIKQSPHYHHHHQYILLSPVSALCSSPSNWRVEEACLYSSLLFPIRRQTQLYYVSSNAADPPWIIFPPQSLGSKLKLQKCQPFHYETSFSAEDMEEERSITLPKEAVSQAASSPHQALYFFLYIFKSIYCCSVLPLEEKILSL